MTANDALLLAFLACLAGAGLTALLARWRTVAGWTAFAAASAAGVLALHGAGSVLAAGTPSPAVTLWSLPAVGSSLRYQVDGLSAVFVSLIAVVSALASLYSIGYLERHRDHGVLRYHPWFLLFVAGMYAVVTLTDLMVFFCAAWQLMTIPSFALVRFEREKPENVRAARRYLLLMEIACALVMGGAALLGGPLPEGGGAAFDFERLSRRLPDLLGRGGGLVVPAFLLFLAGFGIKSGMWPFGRLWLPDAHPAAPSPVSALLSGVMIKTGVYGLVRTFLWLVPPDSLAAFGAGAWGAALAVLGTMTLFVGTLQALRAGPRPSGSSPSTRSARWATSFSGWASASPWPSPAGRSPGSPGALGASASRARSSTC